MPPPKDFKNRKLWLWRQGESHKGKCYSPRTEFKEGQIPWNFGLTKETDERVRKNVEASGRTLRGHIPWNKGKHLTEEHIRNTKEGIKKRGKFWEEDLVKENVCLFCGKPFKPDRLHPHQKYCIKECRDRGSKTEMKICEWCGRKYKVDKKHLAGSRFGSKHCLAKWLAAHRSDKTKKKIAATLRGRTLSEKTKRKISKKMKGCIPKWLRRRIPTSLEKKFQDIVEKHGLPYRYTGNGSFIVGNCNPDFVNTNNEKIAVEVYARYFKQIDGRSIRAWKRDRTQIFKQFGWKIIFFDETQVKEDAVLKTLRSVSRNG